MRDIFFRFFFFRFFFILLQFNFYDFIFCIGFFFILSLFNCTVFKIWYRLLFSRFEFNFNYIFNFYFFLINFVNEQNYTIFFSNFFKFDYFLSDSSILFTKSSVELFDTSVFFSTWFNVFQDWFFWFNLYPVFFVDGISIFFLLLSAFIIPICFLVVPRSFFLTNQLTLLLLSIEILLYFSFCTVDLFWFYFFFEAVLIPMYFLIGLFGSRTRRIKANYYFFLYTVLVSILMLYALFVIFFEVGSLSYFDIFFYNFSTDLERFLWICLFVTFMGKIPMFPFHIWLPEAHVEAPTGGSVLLAGLLLKLGGYGCIRFLIFLFPLSCLYFWPLISLLSILGILYASLAAICQLDLKRIIAYSSIAHMNLIVLGIFSLNFIGIQAGIVMMISHGLVSSGLFILIGILYDRYHTRTISYYSGLVSVMPIFSFFLFFFLLANIGFPGTMSFIGEFLLLIGLSEKSFFFIFFYGIGFVLTVVFSIWLFNRVCFGTLSTNYFSSYLDLTQREFFVVFSLLILVVYFGVNPSIILDLTYSSIKLWL